MNMNKTQEINAMKHLVNISKSKIRIMYIYLNIFITFRDLETQIGKGEKIQVCCILELS